MAFISISETWDQETLLQQISIYPSFDCFVFDFHHNIDHMSTVCAFNPPRKQEFVSNCNVVLKCPAAHKMEAAHATTVGQIKSYKGNEMVGRGGGASRKQT